MVGIIKSKGQIISLDAYIAVGVFLVMVIMLFAFVTERSLTPDFDKESKYITERFVNTPYMEDKTIDSYEELQLSAMTCDELRKLLDTKNKQVCLYLEDSDGNIIPLDQNSKYGLGCPGINISGIPCGYSFVGTATFSGSAPFILRNSGGINVALFSDEGDIMIKGACSAQANCGVAPADSVLIIRDFTGTNDVAYIDNNGNMCIEDTVSGCHDLVADINCLAPVGDSFLVEDLSNKIVSYIDSNGKLCYIGDFETNSIKLN
jgi:hypothetical protein